MAGSSAMLPAQTASAARGSAAEPEPRAFFYDDGRHAAGLYQFAPPLTAADVTCTVDQLVCSGIDTLFYSAGLEGGAVQYDSRVAAKWGDNVTDWHHEIFYRASRTLHQLIAGGIDPMRVLCDRAREKGILFLPSLPVGIVGGDRKEDLGLGRKSDFVYDHPQFQVGPDPDPRAQRPARFLGPNRFSFLHEAVRAERFLIAEELLTRYDTSGIELDLSIDNDFGPLCKYSQVSELAPLMTDWIGRVRASARKAEIASARRKRVYARVPAVTEKHWLEIGLDVRTWVQRKLVDGLVCVSTYRNMVDQDIGIAPAVAAAKGTGCRVLAGFDGVLGRQVSASPTQSMIWAAAANAYERGADGFGLCEGMWAPHGWPWTPDDYQTLRLLGHPDLLATADKSYRARSMARGAEYAPGPFPRDESVLPRVLRQGGSVTFPLRVADRLNEMHALDRIAEVRFRVRFANFEPSLNEVRVELNGRVLDSAKAKMIDLHFRVLETGPVNPYGCVLEFALGPDMFPVRGDNSVKVTLVRRDPRIHVPFEVYDADLDIRYRLHRHFE